MEEPTEPVNLLGAMKALLVFANKWPESAAVWVPIHQPDCKHLVWFPKCGCRSGYEQADISSIVIDQAFYEVLVADMQPKPVRKNLVIYRPKNKPEPEPEPESEEIFETEDELTDTPES